MRLIINSKFMALNILCVYLNTIIIKTENHPNHFKFQLCCYFCNLLSFYFSGYFINNGNFSQALWCMSVITPISTHGLRQTQAKFSETLSQNKPGMVGHNVTQLVYKPSYLGDWNRIVFWGHPRQKHMTLSGK
jgi:hypothetical protein